MAEKLTTKQRLFIKYKAQGMSGAEAARKAGYSPKAASVQASENLAKPNVREAFLAAMEKAGITDDRLTKVMEEGLQASARLSLQVGSDSRGRKVFEIASVPDHHARHKFLKTAVDIKGLEAAKQVNLRDQTLEDLLTLDDGGTDSTTEGAS